MDEDTLRPPCLLTLAPAASANCTAAYTVSAADFTSTSLTDAATAEMTKLVENASLALDIADSVYLLETGRIVLSGSPALIRDNDAVRRSYLGY